jgi:WD40 repeat protein
LTGAIRNRESAARLAGDAFARQTAAEAGSLEAAALATALKAEEEALRKAAGESVTNTASLALAFSENGEILTESIKAGGLRIWSSATGAWIEDANPIEGAQFTAMLGDGTLLAASGDKKATPWTLPGKSWELVKTLGNGKDAKPFVDRVSALAFHPDGSLLLTGTGVPSRSGEITAWDTTTWSPLVSNSEAHDDTITSFAFAPDGSRFASAGTDQFVKLFETATLTHEKTFEGHTSHVLDVDWNPDNLTLASSGADLQVKVWDLGEGQEKSKVEGFKKEVSSVAFVGPSDTLVTASGDKTLKLANAPLPDAGDTFLHTAEVTRDGALIIAGGQDSVLRVWDVQTKKLVKAFESPERDAGKVVKE